MIATYHLDWPDRGFTLYVYHALDRLVLRGFKKIIAVSKPIERSLRRSGLSRRKLATIANGIDLERFRNITRSEPQTASASGGMKVGLVGRLTPQKGHRYLIEAAPKILASCPNVTFLFIGDGPDRQQLETLVKGAGLQNRFAFSGAQRDMPSVYAGLDAVVLPSINEGLPMTLIEALAAARPVVATSVGDVPTLIRNRETGLLVEPRNPEALAQAIISLLIDADLRTTLARNGQQWVEQKFSATAMADRYHDIYRETLQLA